MFMNTLSDINFISPDYPCSLLLWLTFKHLSANLIWIFCKIENCFCAIFCDGTQTEILLTWSMPPPQLRQSRQTRVGSHTSGTCPPAGARVPPCSCATRCSRCSASLWCSSSSCGTGACHRIDNWACLHWRKSSVNTQHTHLFYNEK